MSVAIDCVKYKRKTEVMSQWYRCVVECFGDVNNVALDS
jgi:hypothetical protein